MFAIDDIIWLDRIVEKLAWKHEILPIEVEEVLSGNCRVFRKEKGKIEGNIYTMHWGKPKQDGICLSFLSKS